MKTGELSVTLSLNCSRVCMSVMDFSNSVLWLKICSVSMMHVFGQRITELASFRVCLCAIIAFGVDEVLGQATLPTLLAVRLILHISSSSYLFLKLRQHHILGG